MGISNTHEQAFLDAMLINSTAALTALQGATGYVALYTADPGAAGTAITNEATYTSYARVAVTKSSGFSRSTNTVSNVGAVTWPACTGGSNTITYFAVVTTASGAGSILFSGALTSSLAVSTGITPTAAASALTVVVA